MNFSEITALSEEQIKERILSEEGALQKLKFAHAISPIENPMKIRETRRLIAQLKTGLRQKQSIS
ncbi:MAG: 50S ribosomal protein L29 [Bacteroidota bacterium]